MKLFQSLFYQQVWLTILCLLTISPPTLAETHQRVTITSSRKRFSAIVAVKLVLLSIASVGCVRRVFLRRNTPFLWFYGNLYEGALRCC